MRDSVRGTIYIGASSAMFAVMAVAARALSRHLSAGQLTLARFVFGLVALAVFFAVRRELPRPKRWGVWVARGFFGGLSAYLYFHSIERLEVGPATLLNNTSPVFASVFAFFFLRERMGLHAILGLTVAMLGAAMVGYGVDRPGAAASVGVGVWSGMLSAVLSGIAIVCMRSLRRDHGAPVIFLSFCVFGFFWSLPMAVTHWRPVDASLWPAALLVGSASVAAQLLYTHGLGFIGAGPGSAVNLSMPALSWLMGIFFLGEGVTALSLWGAVVTAGGVLWGSVLGPSLAAGRSASRAAPADL